MQRHGVTPVLAVVVLIGISLVMAAGAFLWMTETTGDVRDRAEGDTTLRVIDSACDTGAFAIGLENAGDAALRSDHANLYVYTVGENLVESVNDIDISGMEFRQPEGQDTLRLFLPSFIEAGQSYTYEVEFPQDNVAVRDLCLLQAGDRNRLPNPGFETAETAHFGGDASRTTASVYDGSYALIGGNSAFGLWDPVWWVRNTSTGRFQADATVTLTTYAKSTQNTSILYGFAGCGGFGTFTVPATSDWQRYTVTFDVPNNCGEPNADGETKFQVRSDVAWNGSVYFDDTQLIDGNWPNP